MDSRGVTGSFVISQCVHDGNKIFSVRRLVPHLVGAFLGFLLYLRCYVLIVILCLLNETIQTVNNGCLVPFIHCFQNLKLVFRIYLLVCSRCWGAVMIAFSVDPAPFAKATAIMTAGFRHIRERNGTVRLRFIPFIILFVCWWTQRYHRVHLQWLERVSRAQCVSQDYL